MRIYVINPQVLMAIRGRTSTTILLRERGGQQVELVFTSLKAMDQLADDIEESVDTMAEGKAGAVWQSPRLSRAIERLAQTLYSDPLQEAGVLERPAFLVPTRRQPPPSQPDSHGPPRVTMRMRQEGEASRPTPGRPPKPPVD